MYNRGEPSTSDLIKAAPLSLDLPVGLRTRWTVMSGGLPAGLRSRWTVMSGGLTVEFGNPTRANRQIVLKRQAVQNWEMVMMEERILTRHPAGKQGVNISREKYAVVREAILACLAAQGQPTFTGLIQDVEARLAGRFDGSISWYVTTVKLDLEARGVLERVPRSSPQRLRLVEKQ